MSIVYTLASAIGFNIPFIFFGIVAIVISIFSKKAAHGILITLTVLEIFSFIGLIRNPFSSGIPSKIILFLCLLALFTWIISITGNKYQDHKIKKALYSQKNSDGSVTIRFFSRGQLLSENTYAQGQPVSVPNVPDTLYLNGEKHLFCGWSPKLVPQALGNIDYSTIYMTEEEAKEEASSSKKLFKK